MKNITFFALIIIVVVVCFIYNVVVTYGSLLIVGFIVPLLLSVGSVVVFCTLLGFLMVVFDNDDKHLTIVGLLFLTTLVLIFICFYYFFYCSLNITLFVVFCFVLVTYLIFYFVFNDDTKDIQQDEAAIELTENTPVNKDPEVKETTPAVCPIKENETATIIIKDIEIINVIQKESKCNTVSFEVQCLTNGKQVFTVGREVQYTPLKGNEVFNVVIAGEGRTNHYYIMKNDKKILVHKNRLSFL